MKSIETQGKTVDQAIELGLYKLGLSRDQVKITILKPATLFDKAVVKLTVGESSESEKALKELVQTLTEKMGLDLVVSVEEQEDRYLVEVGGEDAALIIGKHGESMDNFQFLLGTIFNKGKKHEEYKKVVVDSNNYKSRREDSLKLMATRMAAKCYRERHEVRLNPMTASERRIIHSALSASDRVETESRGKEPNRFVVIKPKASAPKKEKNSEKRENID